MRAASSLPTTSAGGVPAPSVCIIIKTPALGPPLEASPPSRQANMAARWQLGQMWKLEPAYLPVWLRVSLDAERKASVVCGLRFSR